MNEIQLMQSIVASWIAIMSDRDDYIEDHNGDNVSPNLIASGEMESILLRGDNADVSAIADEFCQQLAPLYGSNKGPQVKVAESVIAMFDAVLKLV